MTLVMATKAPNEVTVAAQPYLAGEAPAYADYIVFGSFQWARCCSAFELLDEGDVVTAVARVVPLNTRGADIRWTSAPRVASWSAARSSDRVFRPRTRGGGDDADPDEHDDAHPDPHRRRVEQVGGEREPEDHHEKADEIRSEG